MPVKLVIFTKQLKEISYQHRAFQQITNLKYNKYIKNA